MRSPFDPFPGASESKLPHLTAATGRVSALARGSARVQTYPTAAIQRQHCVNCPSIQASASDRAGTSSDAPAGQQSVRRECCGRHLLFAHSSKGFRSHQ